MQIYELAWLIPLLPLVAFLIVGFLGGKMKDKGGTVALAGVGSAMVLALLVAYQALTAGFDGGATYFEQSMSWVSVGGYNLDLGVYIDTLTALTLIGVLLSRRWSSSPYSVGYMHDQGERKRRHHTEICLFVGVTAWIGTEQQLPATVHILQPSLLIIDRFLVREAGCGLCR